MRACSVLGWMMTLLAPPVFAEVTIQHLDAAKEIGIDPPGAECAILDTSFDEPETIGTVSDLPGKGLLASLLCPSCLQNPRYRVDIPLRRIERDLVPPPSEIWGRFSCDDGCPRWLLREGADAILIVHVGAQIVCGATGNCPGQAYERSEGRWQLVAEFNSNAGAELCASKTRAGHVELWLTPFDDHPTTSRITWQPKKSKQPQAKPAQLQPPRPGAERPPPRAPKR